MRKIGSRLGSSALALASPLFVAAQCGEPRLTFSGFDFAPIPVGASETHQFIVSNQSGVAATLGTISSQALGLAPPFALTGGTCATGGTLGGSGGECTLEITFTPTQVASASDSIELSYGSGGGAPTKVDTRPLTGSGLKALPDAPLSDLGSSPVGLPVTFDVFVWNQSGYAVTLGDVTTNGLGLSGAFARTGGNCASGQVLEPRSGNCDMLITFTPLSVGDFSATIGIAYNWPNSGASQWVSSRPLKASSFVPVAISTTSPYYDIRETGSVQTQSVTVSNAGGFDATLGTISDAGLGLSAPFSLVGGTCKTGQVLPAGGGTCTLDVQFAPTVSGTATDNIEVRYQFPGLPSQSVSQFIAGTAPILDATDCFKSGCSAGQVCWQVTSDASGAGTCIDVPAPPPNCMAPCLWEARKKCLPVMGACNSSTSVGTELCDPQTGWATFSPVAPSTRSSTEYRNQGTACFSERLETAPGAPFAFKFYTDGMSPIGAAFITIGAASRSVVCGPYSTTDQVTSAPPEARFTENDTPECRDWKSTYLDLTNCRSTTPGSCSGL